QLRSAKNPNLPRPTHPVLSTPWLAALAGFTKTLNAAEGLTLLHSTHTIPL
ncbi:hypothetical protein K661_02828, partial [Piscirickettsia salmonis LF-89 = ATCC VR-1361]